MATSRAEGELAHALFSLLSAHIKASHRLLSCISTVARRRTSRLYPRRSNSSMKIGILVGLCRVAVGDAAVVVGSTVLTDVLVSGAGVARRIGGQLRKERKAFLVPCSIPPKYDHGSAAHSHVPCLACSCSASFAMPRKNGCRCSCCAPRNSNCSKLGKLWMAETPSIPDPDNMSLNAPN